MCWQIIALFALLLPLPAQACSSGERFDAILSSLPQKIPEGASVYEVENFPGQAPHFVEAVIIRRVLKGVAFSKIIKLPHYQPDCRYGSFSDGQNFMIAYPSYVLPGVYSIFYLKEDSFEVWQGSPLGLYRDVSFDR